MVIRVLLILLALTGVAQAESLRLVIDGRKPVVGEMIPLVIRGEYTSLITLEKLVFPDSPDYDWIQIARDAWRDEPIGGRTVRVFERRISLFPRRAGPLTIGPVTHRLTVIGRSQPRESLEVTAEPVTIDVLPFPAESPPLASRGLTVEDKLSAEPGALRDGETLLRRVTIRAPGTLPHLLPPRPAMREPWLITFAAPEERRIDLTPDGPVTTVVWEWNLRPKTGEPGVLPGLDIPWFDTAARRMETAAIASIPFGYASFGDNQGGADRTAPRALAFGFAALGSGFAAGLLLASAGLSTRRRADVLRILRRLSPFDPTRRALKRAGRGDDLTAVRRSAERYLRNRAYLGRPVTGRETAALDLALHGRDGPGDLTPARAAEEILRAAGRGAQDRSRRGT